MRKKKMMAAMMAVTLAAVSMAGCGKKPDAAPSADTAAAGTAAGTAAAGTPDTSKEVTLRMFSIADAPLSLELDKKFWTELNETLKSRLNCTISREYASGTNYQNNYQLALASGDKYDMIQSAGYLDYKTHASKGAFLALEELLPVYAPDLWKTIPKERWDEVTVNGHIYGIPSLSNEPATQACFMFREDLRKKYNCPEIVDYDTMGQYLQAIKDNEPELLPSDDYQAQVYGTMFIPSTKYQIFDEMGDNHCNFVVDPKNPGSVIAAAKTDDFLPFVKMMKEWADKGFWSKSVLSSNEWGVFSVMNGKAASSFNAQFPGYRYHAVQLAKDNPGWEIDYFLYNKLNKDSVVLSTPATSTMMSISRTAENPERALMLTNLLMTDKDLNQFVRYGYEGDNYNLLDGKIDTSKINLDTNRFNYFPSDMFMNNEFEIKNAEEYKRYEEFMTDIESRYQTNVLAGFVLDLSIMEAEYNAINQVRIEYGYPLMAGLVDDVDTAYADYIKKLDAAGLETVRQEFERQLTEFNAANK